MKIITIGRGKVYFIFALLNCADIIQQIHFYDDDLAYTSETILTQKRRLKL